MLAPGIVIFTPSMFLGASQHSPHTASDALIEIEKRRVPLILTTRDTRAQLELLRRKIGHGHPFITEGGGGLFIPDGYFALRLDEATRRGRYLCVPFGRSSQEAGEAVEDIAAQAGAEVVRCADMTAREISRNEGTSERDAQASRQREFSERFFFAGNADSTAPAFEKIAGEHNWQLRRREPFWELVSGNDEGRALRYLMRLYREALRSGVRSIGIGASLEDISMLKTCDQAFVLPLRRGHCDEELLSRVPNATKIDDPGVRGWNQTILGVLNRR
jgi:predicted mannosyl-3-phosphoglycerate phosphatase (HAD superfamily)